MHDFDLGSYGRMLTTASPVAQRWVDAGLAWLYGFNHEEAIRCFERALSADPDLALAWWGIGYAIGPHYNKPWEAFEPEERVAAIARAHGAIASGRSLESSTPVERDLLDALAERYPDDPATEDCTRWTEAFAGRMDDVRAAHDHDLDVLAIWAEAQMNRTPWALWDTEAGRPATGASTSIVRERLEQAFDDRPEAWRHPGLLHMYLHLMEMSPTPEVALPHGDRLVTLVPDAGHLIHMATHIDVLCGDYRTTVERNAQAARADERYAAFAGPRNFYTLYRLHNVHFEIYAAMFLGQRSTAHRAAARLNAMLPRDVIAYLPEFFEAFRAMDFHVRVRFGEWRAILEQPMQDEPELFCHSHALQRYARTVALANLGRHDEGRQEMAAYLAARDVVAKATRYLFNNEAKDILRVATAMGEGELAYKSGNIEQGLACLRDAVAASDGLVYDEPWGWMQPPRHALAALLMDQGRHDEAEPIYRADLGLDASLPRPHHHPNNVWSLQGLEECLRRRGETIEHGHVRSAFDRARARADVPIRASCFCRADGSRRDP